MPTTHGTTARRELTTHDSEAPDRVRRLGDRLLAAAVWTLATWTPVHAVAQAVEAPSDRILGLWLVLLLVLWTVLRRRGGAQDEDEGIEPPAGADAWTALGVAAGAGLLSLYVVRPDADDVYFVNRSVGVQDTGLLSDRDTIFTTHALPGSPYEPPLSSIEALVGALARPLQVEAATLAYLVLAPVGAALAVWAVYRLLRAWRIDALVPALLLLSFFIVLGGTHHASFGNFHLARMWQGKSLLVAVLVPLAYAALRHEGRRRGRHVAFLAAIGVAAVGASSTAVMVMPLVAVAGLTPALVQRDLGTVVRGSALMAYPVLAGLAVAAGVLGERAEPQDVLATPGWRGIVTMVLGTGPVLAVTLVGAVLGLLAVRRATWGGGTAAMASVTLVVVLLTPMVLEVLDRLLGAGPVLWRLVWVCPVPALFAAAVAAPVGRRAVVATMGIGVFGLALVGKPLWAEGNGAFLSDRPSWKLPIAERAAASTVLRLVPHGDVAVPWTVGWPLAVMGTEVHAVVPRPEYVAIYAERPEFSADQRRLLHSAALGEPVDAEALRLALAAQEVQLVCLGPRSSAAVVATVLTSGFVAAGADLACTHYLRVRPP